MTERPDLAALLSDPARAQDVPPEQVPALLCQLAGLQNHAGSPAHRSCRPSLRGSPGQYRRRGPTDRHVERLALSPREGPAVHPPYRSQGPVQRTRLVSLVGKKGAIGHGTTPRNRQPSPSRQDLVAALLAQRRARRGVDAHRQAQEGDRHAPRAHADRWHPGLHGAQGRAGHVRRPREAHHTELRAEEEPVDRQARAITLSSPGRLRAGKGARARCGSLPDRRLH